MHGMFDHPSSVHCVHQAWHRLERKNLKETGGNPLSAIHRLLLHFIERRLAALARLDALANVHTEHVVGGCPLHLDVHIYNLLAS
jgi:hypothetical protein